MRKQMREITAIIAFVAFTMASAYADTIIKWDFNGLGEVNGGVRYGPDEYAPEAGDTATGLHTTEGLRRGAGHTTSSTPTDRENAWGGVYFLADKANAVQNTQFFYFTLEADAGYTMTIDGLDTYLFRSDRGPENYRWEYALTTDVFDPSAQWFTIVESRLSPSTTTPCSLDLTLSTFDNLNDIDAVTFRIVMWGDTVARGTFYFHGDHAVSDKNTLTVSGSVNPIPEPATALLAMVGVALFFRRKRV